MSVYLLDQSLYFPDPNMADEDGLIAIGGDLKSERLLAAYRTGIFPWYMEDHIPFWYSPDPRCVLFPHALHISHSMQQCIKKKTFYVTIDSNFNYVIEQCANTNRGKENPGSWINNQFQSAYIQLHQEGFAHSVEVWKDDTIVGGLYGVSLGKCFFGESMFSLENNASKFGFIYLVKKLQEKNFSLIDCQVYTPHLESLGAIEIERVIFLKELESALLHESIIGNWGENAI